MGYKIGDKVKIVSQPVECLCNWVPDMDDYCGMTVEIEDIHKHPSKNGNVVRFVGIPFNWCENCIEIPEEEFDEDIKIEDDELFTMILR